MSKPTYRVEVATTDVSIFYVEADSIDDAMDIAMSGNVEPWRFNEGEPEVAYAVWEPRKPEDRRTSTTRPRPEGP